MGMTKNYRGCLYFHCKIPPSVSNGIAVIENQGISTSKVRQENGSTAQ